MKTIAVSLLVGAGALSMTVLASADGLDSRKPVLESTASAPVDMSSRHRHRRVKRVAVSPLVDAPYVLSYQTYGRRAISPPSPYVNVGNGVYVYGKVPYYDTYTYLPVRYPR